MRTYERISEELAKYRQHVVDVLRFVSTFVSQIPCQYHHEDGTFVKLEEVQVEFQNLVRVGLGSNPVPGKISQNAELAVKMDKVIKEIQDFLKLIAKGEEILEKRGFDLDCISIPKKEAVDSFIGDIMEI